MPAPWFLGILEWSNSCCWLRSPWSLFGQAQWQYRQRLKSITAMINYLPYWNALNASWTRLPVSVFLATSFLRSSPVVMHFHPNWSAMKAAFSYLKLPGGPIRNTRFTKTKQLTQKGSTYLVLAAIFQWWSLMACRAYSKGFVGVDFRKARSIGFLPNSFRFVGCIQIFTLYPYFFNIFEFIYFCIEI